MNPSTKAKTTGKLNLDYILEQLQQDRIISPQQVAQLRAGLTKETETSTHPLVIVADQGWQSSTKPAYPLTLEQLTRWLANKIGQTYLRIDPLKMDVNKITGVVSQAYASKLHILPVAVNEKELTIATCEPFVEAWESELARISNKQIKRVIVNPRDLERYLVEFYGISRSILGAMSDDSQKALSNIQNFEQLVEVGKVGEPDANDRHVVNLVDWLLQFAFEQRASDIHLEPRRDKGKVRFRIDGVLHYVHEFPVALMSAITSRLKSLGRMDVTDRRRPQDGRVKTKTPSGNEVEMRLSTMPTTFGEKLVLRIFDPEMLMKSFKELGFTKHDQECWQRMVENPHGIILVTGPTGSGKTTTLYSALKQLARPELNICTIEDPIELVEPLFNQMQVQPIIDVTFAAGVRTLLRQDPDIIMVGEIRDSETAEVAIQAALTGHLVLSSLHTNDAPSSITRLLDIGAQPYLIGASLLGVLAQRLIRTLCPHCKQAVELDKKVWNDLVAPNKTRLPKTIYKAVGCEECRHTGYYGRTGIYEALFIDNEFQHLINTSRDLTDYYAAAAKQGMRPLNISGAQKIAEGLTTLEEIYSVVPPVTGSIK
ncbi:MAG: type II secretion system protein E [Gammaproteobacteria bacterium RIFCSPLOWO2_12_FULL_52_10]|nr:MAG: type II secretion system protein E [Gammaproteobacteria bacterium RIFCSPLOWO2_12_FULL_52_10]